MIRSPGCGRQMFRALAGARQTRNSADPGYNGFFESGAGSLETSAKKQILARIAPEPTLPRGE